VLDRNRPLGVGDERGGTGLRESVPPLVERVPVQGDEGGEVVVGPVIHEVGLVAQAAYVVP
jgi:hypothetical protein